MTNKNIAIILSTLEIARKHLGVTMDNCSGCVGGKCEDEFCPTFIDYKKTIKSIGIIKMEKGEN